MSKASEEAQKQLDRIVALGYPDVADMSAAASARLRARLSVRWRIAAMKLDWARRSFWYLRASWCLLNR